MRILIDCDGVLVDFVGGLCEGLDEYGCTRKPEDFTHWDLSHTLSKGEQSLMRTVTHTPGWCFGLGWYPGARELLTTLRAKGHEVVCVTAPLSSSETWLEERSTALQSFGGFDAKDIVFCPSKQKPHMSGHALIEDHPGTLHAWLEAREGGRGALLSRPWNQAHAKEFKPHAQMSRADSYNALASMFA